MAIRFLPILVPPGGSEIVVLSSGTGLAGTGTLTSAHGFPIGAVVDGWLGAALSLALVPRLLPAPAGLVTVSLRLALRLALAPDGGFVLGRDLGLTLRSALARLDDRIRGLTVRCEDPTPRRRRPLFGSAVGRLMQH